MLKVLRSQLDTVIAVDPAISERSTASRTAVVVMGISPFNKIFLLEYWVGRQGDPAKVIETILKLAYDWQPRVIGIEAVAYQKALEPFIKREMMSRNEWYPIQMMKPDRNEKKEQRILSLQPYFQAGQIYIMRGALEFIEEYETFPLGQTRDILDAMAYAIRLLVPIEKSQKPALAERLRELARKDPLSARVWRADAVKRGDLEPEETLDEILDEHEMSQTGVGEWS